jgi:hypothetical protein
MAKPFFQSFYLARQKSGREHYGPPFMQQLPGGDVIIQGGRQLSAKDDPAKWRDMGRKPVPGYAFRSADFGRTFYPDPLARVGQVIDRSTGEIFSIKHADTPLKRSDGEPITEAWMVRHWRETRDLGRKMVLSRSADGGRTWSDTDVTDRFYAYTDPQTGRSEGLAWFIGHGIQLERGEYTGRLIIPGRFFAAEWEPFESERHHVVKHSHGAGWIYDDGRGQESETLNEHACNCIIYSDDHGETWHWGGHSQGFSGEACIAELSDGSVYINNRNHNVGTLGYRTWAISRDGGLSFTEFGVDRTLVEGRCHASLARYSFPDDDGPGRLLFLNPAVFDDVTQDPAPRHHMTVRLSYDDGKTWPVSKCLREEPAGYSDMIVLTDGTILCGFETSESGLARDDVMVCRFNMEWLESNL